MAVREGYKQTEVGVIPEDWEVNHVGEINDVKAGGTPSTFIKEYWNGSIRWMSSGELNNKRINDVEGRITELGLKNSSASIIPINSVLIGLAGQGKTRGTVAINYVELCTNQSIASIYPNKNVSHEFMYQYLDSQYEQIRKLSYGEGGRGGLNLRIIKSIKVPIPPLPEQKAIATALSDIDDLINSLSKLIEKKKNIKQGAMQELLTGKKRLEGFSGEWLEVKLGDILEIGHGQSQQEIENINGKYPILGSSGEIGRTDNVLYDKPSVLIGRKGTINEPQYMDSPFWTIDTLFFTKLEHSISAKFIYYLFCTINWLNYNEASGVPSLSSKTIKSINVTIPNYKEQKAIATILSDMDKEIEKLQARLDKYKAIKQGMMQELLTGRIRLLEGA